MEVSQDAWFTKPAAGANPTVSRPGGMFALYPAEFATEFEVPEQAFPALTDAPSAVEKPAQSSSSDLVREMIELKLGEVEQLLDSRLRALTQDISRGQGC